MARVIIVESLRREILKGFGAESKAIFRRMLEFGDRPTAGKALASVGGILIKEIKHKTFRFYCIGDAHVWKFATTDELAALLIKFVAMSKKKDQQAQIERIKDVLRSFGFDGF